MHTFGTVYADLCASLASLWFLWRLLALIGRRGRPGGSQRPSVSTSTREPGTTTPATGTPAASSSYSGRGTASGVTVLDHWRTLAQPPSESNYFRHGLSTGVTEAPGESGVLQVSAVYVDGRNGRVLEMLDPEGKPVRPWPSWSA